MTSAFAETPPITARDDDALLRDLVALLATVRISSPAPRKLSPAPYTGLTTHRRYSSTSPVPTTSPTQPSSRPRSWSTSCRPRANAHSWSGGPIHRVWLDLRPGDILVVARAESIADARLRATYEAAQAHGVQVAVPLSSSDALVEALALLGSLDAGIFCADDRTYRAAARASEGRDIAVHRVNGKDVWKATVRALAP